MAIDLGYEREKKILLVLTGLSMFSLCLLIVAVSTPYWLYIDVQDFAHNVSSSRTHYDMETHSGLWKHCKTIYVNSTGAEVVEVICTKKDFSKSNKREDVSEPDENADLNTDFPRTESALAIIGLVLIVMAIGFAMYSFRQSRYMYKRVAGCVYLISAACILICLEVLINSVSQEDLYPLATKFQFNIKNVKYGFSFYLAWISFGIVAINGSAFLLLSKKRKGERAYNENEALANEPMQLGRL